MDIDNFIKFSKFQTISYPYSEQTLIYQMSKTGSTRSDTLCLVPCPGPARLVACQARAPGTDQPYPNYLNRTSVSFGVSEAAHPPRPFAKAFWKGQSRAL